MLTPCTVSAVYLDPTCYLGAAPCPATCPARSSLRYEATTPFGETHSVHVGWLMTLGGGLQVSPRASGGQVPWHINTAFKPASCFEDGKGKWYLGTCGLSGESGAPSPYDRCKKSTMMFHFLEINSTDGSPFGLKLAKSNEFSASAVANHWHATWSSPSLSNGQDLPGNSKLREYPSFNMLKNLLRGSSLRRLQGARNYF